MAAKTAHGFGKLTAAAAVVVVLLCCTQVEARPVIGFMTDYGLDNEAVGLCKGAMARVDDDILVVDITHNVEQYSITHGALALRRTTVFPKGSVFVCVVDPGVGTKRRGIALETKNGYTYVGPDNGLFSLVARDQGIAKVVELDPEKVNPQWKPGTFDGRDLFSPAGAMIASTGKLEAAGKVVSADGIVVTEFPSAKWDAKKRQLHGEYLRTDKPFGNVWTNITADDLTSAGISFGDSVLVTIGRYRLDLPFDVSFARVGEGETIAYLSSDGSFALAINMGNFAEGYSVDEGTTLTVKKIVPGQE